MIFKIAWRNIWRNKRRTLITAASIFFAVLFSVATYSFNRGIFDNIINSAVNSFVGFAQIHQKGYWDDQSINNSFELSRENKEKIMALSEVKGVIPRLESFALASFGKNTKSSMVVGIDPEAENNLSGLSEKVVEGEYLQAEDQALLVSEGLANKLRMTIGDTLILISQGYRGVNAAQMYPIKGIVSFGSPEMNQRLVYMPLATAQYFYGATNLITSAVLNIDNKVDAARVMPKLRNSIDTAQYEVMGWEKLMPEIVEMRDLKSSGNVVTIFILYLIVSFGVFGTILMMTKEREYEFGILLSIGMKRGQLALAIWLETILLALLGVVIGIVLSYGLMYYLKINPIVVTGDMAETYAKFGIAATLPPSTDWDIFAVQGFVVLVISTLIALYPAYKIWKMKPVEAMRG